MGQENDLLSSRDSRVLQELAVVEKALARILQEENPLPLAQHEARHAELSRRLHGAAPSSPSPPLHSEDLTIISRLLNQVACNYLTCIDRQVKWTGSRNWTVIRCGGDWQPARHVKNVHLLMEEERGGEVLSKFESDQRPGLHHVNVAAEKNVVEAVVEIASAAAEAAKAAAASSGKNLEVMETLLAKSENGMHPKRTNAESHDEESSRPDVADKDDQGHGAPRVNKDLLKKLERQNTITHWVLGFMVVATAIWRFKVLSMIMGVRKTFTNPFQAIGDIFFEGIKGANKEDPNGASKGFQKARTVLPSLLGGEEKEITEKTETSTKEDFKISEALTLSLDNLLHVGKSPSGGNDREDDSSTE